MLARLSCLALVLAGCDLYLHDSSHDVPPDADDCFVEPESTILAQDLRDPSSGQCPAPDPWYGCNNNQYAPPVEQWARCDGSCEALDEATCLITAGCHATYWISDLDDNMAPTFWGCWEVEPDGPLHGSCDWLDAYTCTAHDDCVGLYQQQSDGVSGEYQSCVPEPQQPPACSTLVTEAACEARPDCDPVYAGSNCTCDEHGCTCQTETFEYCE